MKKNILYIHGLSSSGASSTAQNLRELLPECEVTAPDLPLNPVEALTMLRSLCHEIQPQVIIGTSMGAMLAQQIRGYKKVLVNPAFHVSEFMRKHIGMNDFLNHRQDGATSYEITPELCDAYQALEKKQFDCIENSDIENTFALFGNKDTLVNGYDEYIKYYGSKHAYKFNGEHRLSREDVEYTVAPLIMGLLLKDSPLFNLSLSSKELFHSNFLYWIGVKYPDWFVTICEELVGHSVQWKDKRWEVKREYNHYDLCLVYKVEKKGIRKKETFKEEIPFVLENKVKSIPYKEQLDGYANKSKEPIELERDWVLLSLSTDFPDKKTIEEDKIWKVKNYNGLYTAIVQNKDKYVHNQYDLFLIEDYCLFIKYMHKLVETWDIKKEDKFHSKEDMKKLYKDLRIGDLYEKIRYNQAFNLLQNELKEKLNLSQDDIKKKVDIKVIKENKENQYVPLKHVFINWGFTHGQGLLEAKVKVSDEYVLLIQIQGNKYCHGVEWIKEGSQSHAQYWKDTKENQLIKKLSFFLFEDESNIFPNVCLQESTNIRNAKEGACIYNKYGDRFLYQYNKIKDGVSASDIIEAIVEKIGIILGKELPHSPRKYTSNY